MALAVDAGALAILHMLDPHPLAGAEPAAVGAAARDIGGDPPFLALEPIGLARGQLAGGDAAGDALLLVRLALVDPGLGGRGGDRRQTEQRRRRGMWYACRFSSGFPVPGPNGRGRRALRSRT